MTGNEITAGDIVRHRHSGKQGRVQTVFKREAWWPATPGTRIQIPPYRAVVWWDGEQEPAVEDPDGLEKLEPEAADG